MLKPIVNLVLSMKKLFIILQTVIILLSFTKLYSQSGWYSQTSGTSYSLHGVSFVNANVGTAVGDAGTILRTTNGGLNWYIITSGFSGFHKLCFLNLDTGTIVGAFGSIIFTTNGGSSWIIKSSGTSSNLNKIRFVKTNTGFTPTGFIVGVNGVILKTTNSGNNWFSQNSTTNHYLYGVYFTDINTGYVVGQAGYISGQSTILKTTNGGNTWLNISPNITKTLTGVCFFNPNTGVVVGGSGYYTNGIILKTTDGGNNWQIVFTSSSAFQTISYPNNNIVTAVGNGGLIVKSTDAGSAWFIQNTPTTTLLKDVSFVNDNTGWVVGNGGIILKTTSGGNPIPQAPTLVSPPNNSVNISLTPTLTWDTSQGATNYHVQVSSSTNFQVITDSATVTATQYQVPSGKLQNNTVYFWRANASNSAGTSAWSSIWNFTTLSAPPQTPVLISPPDSATLVPTTPLLDWGDVSTATSYRLQVSEVPNFMTTVIDQVSLTLSQYQVPSGILSNNVTYYWRARARNASGWSPWASAWIFTTEPSGINQISTEIPTRYNLFQNYPNPFNPSTTIRFDIPKSSNVKLIVYNNLGRIVSEPVNEKLSAGSYEVSWSPQNVSSGIYFYRIETEEFSDVKKMLYIK